jgi:hypothetical protein
LRSQQSWLQLSEFRSDEQSADLIRSDTPVALIVDSNLADAR